MLRFILRVFFLRELIFADRGQSAKSAKIRTRKIFMLHGRRILREKADCKQSRIVTTSIFVYIIFKLVSKLAFLEFDDVRAFWPRNLEFSLALCNSH